MAQTSVQSVLQQLLSAPAHNEVRAPKVDLRTQYTESEPSKMKEVMNEFILQMSTVSGKAEDVEKIKELIAILQVRVTCLQNNKIANTISPTLPERQTTVFPAIRTQRNNSILECLHSVDPDFDEKSVPKCELCSISRDNLDGVMNPRMAGYGPGSYGR